MCCMRCAVPACCPSGGPECQGHGPACLAAAAASAPWWHRVTAGAQWVCTLAGVCDSSSHLYMQTAGVMHRPVPTAPAPTAHHLWRVSCTRTASCKIIYFRRCRPLPVPTPVEACGPDLAVHAHSCPTPAGIKMKASFAEEQPSSSGGSGSASNGSAAHAEQAQQQQQQLFGRRKWKHWFRRWQIR